MVGPRADRGGGLVGVEPVVGEGRHVEGKE